MTIIEAIIERHSVRSYLDKRIEAEKVALLQERIKELNERGDLHMQFIEDAGNTYNRSLNKMMGLGSAPSTIACVGAEADDLEERIGYYGEELVLYAQQLGLNTCWTGIFSKSGVPAEVKPGERVVICIAIGYGVNPGKPRKSKSVDDVAVCIGERPEWFDKAVGLTLLAPTAINQQKFEIRYENGDVTFKDKGGPFSKVDLGIVKYHFEVGREAEKGE